MIVILDLLVVLVALLIAPVITMICWFFLVVAGETKLYFRYFLFSVNY